MSATDSSSELRLTKISSLLCTDSNFYLVVLLRCCMPVKVCRNEEHQQGNFHSHLLFNPLRHNIPTGAKHLYLGDFSPENLPNLESTIKEKYSDVKVSLASR